MKTLDLIPGTAEWLAARSRYRCASDAPAMMGVSKVETRNQLLARLKSGAPKEFSDYVKDIVIEPGHTAEAEARPLAVEIVGEGLYPLVVTDDTDYVLASLDGATMDEEIIWEHKRFNQESFDMVKSGMCPPWHYWQVVQSLYITGAKKCLFMVSDGTKENCAWMWVELGPAGHEFGTLLAGWAQFDVDEEAFQPVEVLDAPVAKTIERLPALAVLVKGEVVASNLPAFKAASEKYLASINTTLTTDQHFADAEADAKYCREMAKKIELAVESALAQVASIDEVVRTGKALFELYNKKGLFLEKAVKSEKDTIRTDIVDKVQSKFKEHVKQINTELQNSTGVALLSIPLESPDFWEAVKNKRTVESLQNAVDTLLAAATIAADAMARDYRAKLAWLTEHGKGYAYPDLQVLLAKPMDDFKLTIEARIKRIEDDAERVRQEKEAKDAADALAAQNAQVAAPAQPAPAAQATEAAPTSNVVKIGGSVSGGLFEPARHAAFAGKKIKLGEICERLGFNLSAEFMEQKLKFVATSDPNTRNAKLYLEADYDLMCDRLKDHIESTKQKPQAA